MHAPHCTRRSPSASPTCYMLRPFTPAGTRAVDVGTSAPVNGVKNIGIDMGIDMGIAIATGAACPRTNSAAVSCC